MWYLIKKAFNPNFEKLRKNLKNMFTNMTPLQIAIFATHQVKKVLGEKISCFPIRIQISAILFQVDCAINGL